MKLALKQLTQGPAVEALDVPRAEALDRVIRGLVAPLDLLQPGHVENFVTAFLQSPGLRRPNDPQVKEGDWVKLDSTEEHAQWIRGERELVDLLGSELSRQQIVIDPTADKDFLVKAVLQTQGTFVALTDAEGRLDRLVDRAALLERVAAGAEA
jgi:hypothetical protein